MMMILMHMNYMLSFNCLRSISEQNSCCVFSTVLTASWFLFSRKRAEQSLEFTRLSLWYSQVLMYLSETRYLILCIDYAGPIANCVKPRGHGWESSWNPWVVQMQFDWKSILGIGFKIHSLCAKPKAMGKMLISRLSTAERVPPEPHRPTNL